jgi:hypothetical protein
LYTADLISIIEEHSLLPHSYADDTQIYGFCQPDDESICRLRNSVLVCIDEVSAWMKSNRLQLNPLKTEFLWCASSRRQNALDCSPFVIGADSIQPADVVRNLGLQLECDLSMNTHISKVVSMCFGILRQLRFVAWSLPRDVKRQLIQTFILSRVDYCNVAFAGIPKRQTDRLQAIIYASARLVSGTRMFDQITHFS